MNGHCSNAPKIIEVTWIPPSCYMVKCNTDGAAKGSPGPASCGGIFRDHSTTALGSFAANLGSRNAFEAELIGAMMAIEITHKKDWKFLWLECDSQLVINAFKNHVIVPWKLINKWKNCIEITEDMMFDVCIFSYVQRREFLYTD